MEARRDSRYLDLPAVSRAGGAEMDSVMLKGALVGEE